MMLTTTSSTVSNILANPCIKCHQRFHVWNRRFLLAVSEQELGHCQFLGNQILEISTSSFKLHRANNKKDMALVYCGVDPGPIIPSDPSSGSWKMWIVGMLITVVLPFWRNKFWPLIKLKDGVESAVETAEKVTEMVEKVAEVVEKVAEEVADHLPEGGKLKEAVTMVENVAKDTAKDAHLAEEIIDKVEKVEKEAESLIDSVVDQANDIIKEAKH